MFDKIQYDLISYENRDLRRLWNFLRKTDLISIIDIDADPTQYEQIKDKLDKWIIDSIELTRRNENAVFFADDLNFLRLLKEFKVKGCITYFFLNSLLENTFIDSKTFGISIGRLAERIYIFLPFDGEDLYNIVMNDECKITLRSYHLINQITLPGSPVSKYTKEFAYFMEKLWKSGSRSEEKQNWLKLITDKTLAAIEINIISNNKVQQSLITHDLISVWRAAISSSSAIELTIIEKDFNDLFKKDVFSDIRESIKAMLYLKKSDLNP